MAKFIKKNSYHGIISCDHVNTDGKPIKGKDKSAGVTYTFSDQNTMTVWKNDIQSAPNYTPKWCLK